MFIPPRALRLIRDCGEVLYDRINAQGYTGCQEDIQAASAMADDVRDAVIDYQVGEHEVYTTAVTNIWPF